MKAGKYAILLIVLVLFLVLALGTVVAGDTGVYGTEYRPEDAGTIYAQVLDGSGTPVNDATVTLTLWDSEGNKELDGVSMTYITGSQGIYRYNFTVPADEGVYVAEVVTANPTGYGSGDIHVSETGGGGTTPAAIWGEGISDYTDTSTFGGVLNDILGGGTMPMLFILGLLALGLTLGFFWKQSAVLAYGASGTWMLLGFQALTQSSSAVFPIQDTYMGLFWICVVFCIACIFLPSVMKEKPSPDDIYVEDVDEVTGDPIKREEATAVATEQRPRRRKKKLSWFDRMGR